MDRGVNVTCTIRISSSSEARANAWTRWENYDKFFAQMIRWAMRPVNEEGKFSVATDVKDGKVRVVVTALDKDDQFLNFLNMSAVAVDPNLEDFQVKIEQVAPGRYVGEFPADKAGSYFVNVVPGPGKSPILAGVTVVAAGPAIAAPPSTWVIARVCVPSRARSRSASISSAVA